MQTAGTKKTPLWLVLLLLVAFVVLSLASRLVPWFLSEPLGQHPIFRELLVSIVALGSVIALTVAVQRRWPVLWPKGFELLPWSSKRTLLLVLLGALIGTTMIATTYLIVGATGGVSVRYIGPTGLSLMMFLTSALGVTILAAAWEELTFRGWPFLITTARFGAHTMAWAVGTIFGFAHLLNPEWSVTSIFSVALAGVFLGYSMLVSKKIAFPIGLHLGWNFGRTLLMSRTLWEVTRHGSELRSGGAGGLESSLAGVLITATGALVMLIVFVTSARRRVVPTEFRDQTLP